MNHRRLLNISVFVIILLISVFIIINIKSKNELPVISPNTSKAISIPVLLYHGVLEKEDDYNITIDKFNEQMSALKEAGYQAISLDQFNEFRSNRASLPEKSILITFDDGRSDTFNNADPILKKLNYRALNFVIGQRLDDTNNGFYFTRDQLSKMIETGRWDIGAHAYYGHSMIPTNAEGVEGHFYGNKKWLVSESRIETDEEYKTRINEDLNLSKKSVESLDVKLVSFAFPFGDYGQESLNYPEARSVVLDSIENLYDYYFYQSWVNDAFSFNYADNTKLIKRIEPSAAWDGAKLVKVLSGSEEKDLPFTLNSFSEFDTWKSNYGGMDINNNVISIYPKDGYGSSITLDGTRSWSNYKFTSAVAWENGSTISAIARYMDENNYVGFSITAEKLILKQKINGKLVTLIELPNTLSYDKQSLNIGISTAGNQINGYVNGIDVINAKLSDESLTNGGIGIRIQDSIKNNTKIMIKNIMVSPI